MQRKDGDVQVGLLDVYRDQKTSCPKKSDDTPHGFNTECLNPEEPV